MAVGGFDLRMAVNTPERIRKLTDSAFSQVVVTATWVDSSALSTSELLNLARWSGLLRKRSADRTRWEGPGIAALLGDEDGKANTYSAPLSASARPLYDGSNTSAIRTNVLRLSGDGANGITVGTIASSATPTKTFNIEVGDSPRDVLDAVCDIFTTSGTDPYEWRINPDGTLDVAKRATLFPATASPTVLASRRRDALAVGDELLPVTSWDNVDDWDDWTSTVTVTGPTVTLYGSEYTYSGIDTIGSNPYADLAGADLLMRRVVETNKSNNNATNESIAERVLGRYDDVERRPTLSTDAYDPGKLCPVGDSILVFDLDAGIYDKSSQKDAGSMLVFPRTVRVVGMTWPVRDGMGVYVVDRTSGSAVVTDVSEWVLPETGDARVEVGAPRRLLGLARRGSLV